MIEGKARVSLFVLFLILLERTDLVPSIIKKENYRREKVLYIYQDLVNTIQESGQRVIQKIIMLSHDLHKIIEMVSLEEDQLKKHMPRYINLCFQKNL